MQVNMLEAKNQLSRLVKAALAGEEVIIASHGQPRVRLVPCSESPGLRHCGALSGESRRRNAHGSKRPSAPRPTMPPSS